MKEYRARQELLFQGDDPDRGDLSYAPVLVSTRPYRRRFSVPVSVPGSPMAYASEEQVAVGRSGQAVVGFAHGDPGACNESRCRGAPRISRLLRDTPLAALGPALAFPSRAQQPAMAVTTTGTALTAFVLKERPEPFVDAGPIHATAITSDGQVAPLQRLTRTAARAPQVVGLADGQALCVWSVGRYEVRSFGAAIADRTGRFRAISPPAGRPARPGFGQSWSLRTAGQWIQLAWRDVNGQIRVTRRRA